MATYHSTIFIKPDTARRIADYLDNEPESEADAFIDDAIVHEAQFPNGFVVLIDCYGVADYIADDNNTAYGVVELVNDFANDFVEVDSKRCETSEEFFSDWTLHDEDGNEYVTHIIVNEED